MIKKRYLLLLIVIFLFTISTVSAEEIVNETNDLSLARNDDSLKVFDYKLDSEVIKNDYGLLSVENNEEILNIKEGTFSELASEIGSGGNITLKKDIYNYDSGSTIHIFESGTINGNGAIIDMEGSKCGVFSVSANNVIIKDITFKNINGLAIRLSLNSMDYIATVKNCSFINNSGGAGGAIYLGWNYGILENCIFINNTASSYGGAVFSQFFTRVNNCLFVNNTAKYGGAIYGFSTVSNSTFINNSASNNGGAIYFTTGTCVISNCSFSNNIASRYGGAVYLSGSSSVNNCSFVSNAASSSGGAVYLSGSSSVNNCSFVSNAASSSGGAIYINDGSVKNSVFVNNSASHGGAVENPDILENCIFVNNFADYDGGAIYLFSKCNITNCSFINNKALNGLSSGGAIFCSADIINSLENCIFVNNSADYDGGAIYFFNCTGNINNCSFINNKALNGHNGGAIYFFNGSDSVENCVFVNNSASYGGAIYFANDDSSVKCSVFVNNSANNGGAIYFANDDGSVENCVFVNNSARYGGALRGSEVVDKSVFVNNSAIYEGGAIYSGSYTIIVSNSSFVNNIAKKGKAIVSKGGNANNNWWGENEPRGGNLISGVETLSSIAVLNVYAIPENISVVSNTKLYYVFYSSETNNIIPISISQIELSSNGGKLKNNLGYLINGEFFTEFSSNTIGDYEITAKVDNQLVKTKVHVTDKQIIPKKNVTMGISVPKVMEGENVNVTITLPYDATGTVSVGDKIALVKKGKSIVTIFNLPVGKTVLPVKYSGDEKYNSAEDSVTIIVDEKNPIIIIESHNVTKYYSDSDIFNVRVFSSMGNYMSGQVVKFAIGINSYESITDSNGYAYLNTHLQPGSYIIKTSCNGNEVINKINILATIYDDDMKVSSSDIYQGENEIIKIVLPDDAMGKVVTIINNNEYSTNIDKGVGNIIIPDLKPNNYSIEIVYSGDSQYNSIKQIANFVVNKKIIINAPDVTKDFGGSEKFVVTLMDKNNQPIPNVNVNININNANYIRTTDNDGVASLVLNLDSGIYNAIINYKDISTSAKITVNQLTTKTTLSSIMTSSNNVTLTAEIVPSTASGNVVFNINGINHIAKISSSKAICTLSNLDIGSYYVKAVYDGDKNHKNSESNVISFTVNNKIEVNAPDLTKYYKGSERFVVTVMEDNKPLVNKEITILINGALYTKTTNINGQVSMGINLNSGQYEIITECDGIKFKSTITIKPTISGNDVTKIYKNGTQYYATFVDTKGNFLKNTKVNFNINGVLYNRTTNDQGIAKMNINLNPGIYVITALNPESEERHTNIITVLSSIVENYDLIKYYRNESKYTLRILDSKGNPAGAGETVRLNINGVFYERKTNASGYMNMNINLNPGTYIVTAEYNGLMASSTVRVLPILSAKDVNMKYRDGTKFELKLLDGKGKPFAAQKITFNINGVFYERITDSNGIARLNLNLQAGEYIITSMYENGASLANKVTISS